jgi:hypothetical protein
MGHPAEWAIPVTKALAYRYFGLPKL